MARSNEGWKPMMTLCSLLTTFKSDRPKKFYGTNRELIEQLNLYALCTEKLLDGIIEVFDEISQEKMNDKTSRDNLEKNADIIASNQASNAASNMLNSCKNEMLNAARTFAIHDFDMSILPELDSDQKFHSKNQIADALKIPKDAQRDIQISTFRKKNAKSSTLIVKCTDFDKKTQIERNVRSNFKTSLNLPKYLYQFVKKMRPLYVNLGSKIEKISCPDPYILIRPNKDCDKLCSSERSYS